MKDGLMLFAGIALVFGLIVYGIYKFTRTGYDAPQKSQEEINEAYEEKVSYQQQIDDVERRRKDLMRQQKQRLRDMQRH